MDSLGQASTGRSSISTSELEGRGDAWTEERGTSDEGRRRSEGGMGRRVGARRRAGDSGVGVLDRSMALLDLLADGPRSLRSLVQASGLPRPTAHRLLVALETHGLVGRDADGAFRLGPRLTELALRAGRGLELGTLASGVLARLHDQTGESVQLYLRSGDRRLCVAAVVAPVQGELDGPQRPLGVVGAVGRLVPGIGIRHDVLLTQNVRLAGQASQLGREPSAAGLRQEVRAARRSAPGRREASGRWTIRRSAGGPPELPRLTASASPRSGLLACPDQVPLRLLRMSTERRI